MSGRSPDRPKLNLSRHPAILFLAGDLVDRLQTAGVFSRDHTEATDLRWIEIGAMALCRTIRDLSDRHLEV
jgi:hypothetical protein